MESGNINLIDRSLTVLSLSTSRLCLVQNLASLFLSLEQRKKSFRMTQSHAEEVPDAAFIPGNIMCRSVWKAQQFTPSSHQRSKAQERTGSAAVLAPAVPALDKESALVNTFRLSSP